MLTLIKGTGSLVEYFFKAYKIKSVYFVHAKMVSKFLAWLVKEKNIYKFSVCFFEKTLTNSKNCSGSRIIISVPATLSIIGQFSSMSTPFWIKEKSA